MNRCSTWVEYVHPPINRRRYNNHGGALSAAEVGAEVAWLRKIVHVGDSVNVYNVRLAAPR